MSPLARDKHFRKRGAGSLERAHQIPKGQRRGRVLLGQLLERLLPLESAVGAQIPGRRLAQGGGAAQSGGGSTPHGAGGPAGGGAGTAPDAYSTWGGGRKSGLSLAREPPPKLGAKSGAEPDHPPAAPARQSYSTLAASGLLGVWPIPPASACVTWPGAWAQARAPGSAINVTQYCSAFGCHFAG